MRLKITKQDLPEEQKIKMRISGLLCLFIGQSLAIPTEENDWQAIREKRLMDHQRKMARVINDAFKKLENAQGRLGQNTKAQQEINVKTLVGAEKADEVLDKIADLQ